MKGKQNLTIGKKLIAAFLIAILLASIAGICAITSMNTISTRYTEALNHYGFSQGDVGSALAMLGRIDGNVHDAIGYMDKENASAAQKNVSKYEPNMNEILSAVESVCITDEEKELYNTISSAWTKYIAKAKELVNEGTEADVAKVKEIQLKLVNELDPIYVRMYSALSELLSLKVEKGDTEDKALNRRVTISMIIAIVLLILSIFLAVALGISISKTISESIKRCVKRLEQLAEGDFTSPIPESMHKDETQLLTEATKKIVNTISRITNDIDYMLQSMSDGNFRVDSSCEDYYIGDFSSILKATRNINLTLSATLSQINNAADQVASGADQVSNGAQALSQGATEQAASIEELSATIADITENIKKNANDAKHANEISNLAAGGVLESNDKMQELTAAMSEISEKSAEINKIIKAIDDIAFQTNILALNAAVEAARAGAAGKGFAVVADEVRNLAQKSADAAKNTSDLIVAAIKAIDRGSKITKETAAALQDVVAKAKVVSSTIVDIAAASEVQATAAMQINTGVDQIAAVVQTNSATAQESAAASEEFNGQAQTLKNLISGFKLRQDTDDYGNSHFTEDIFEDASENSDSDDIVVSDDSDDSSKNEDSSAIKELLDDDAEGDIAPVSFTATDSDKY